MSWATNAYSTTMTSSTNIVISIDSHEVDEPPVEVACENCDDLVYLDHVADGVECWLHSTTGLGECDPNAPFGPGACPVED